MDLNKVATLNATGARSPWAKMYLQLYEENQRLRRELQRAHVMMSVFLRKKAEADHQLARLCDVVLRMPAGQRNDSA
jgi:hypothetical protein